MPMDQGDQLKLRTARSMKWGLIDRFASQGIYAATGIVLAWLLSPADFGLVGAALIFQAFAMILVDSGFSSALLQLKSPSRLDYSTALWFNIGVSILLYLILFFCAPLIADCFGGDSRLILISRVMFISMILNAASIVQINQLTKSMRMRPVAVANLASLALGAVAALILAATGYGAWAIVWQSIVSLGSKAVILWCTSRWAPVLRFSWHSLQALLPVGTGMMATSFLNTLFTNIYSFIIGNQQGMAHLGYYTQSDKWSKMGIMSLSQTLTSAFVPPLSAAQDDPARFRRLCSKMNRVTTYILFPMMCGLCVMATPIFHAIFGTKWDPSIPLFQLLLIRGIFAVLTNLYNNYLLALGRARLIVRLEVVRDATALIALVVTMPYINISTLDNLLWGVEIMVLGQIAASAVAWIATLVCVCHASDASVAAYLRDCAPYAALTLLILPLLYWLGTLGWCAWATVIAQSIAGLGIYLLINRLLGSKVQSEALAYLRGRL